VPDRLGPAIGFVITLFVSAGFIPRLAPGLTPSPTVGTGGYIGATIAIFLEAYFHLTGMILILTAIGLFGLALSHEVLVVWPFQELRGWATKRWRQRGARAELA
jgi:DNA segregation ATPase FtsK/SpoIIIE, S-DNA-T family